MQRQIFLIVSLDGQLCLKKESALVQPQKSKEEKKKHTQTQKTKELFGTMQQAASGGAAPVTM